jgi:hypothetical protein
MSMSTVSCNSSSAEIAWAKALGAAPCLWLLAYELVASVLLIGACEAHLTLESPGATIRHDLARVGSELTSLGSSTPTESVQQVVSRYFPGYRATVDAAPFPAYVRVTLHDLDSASCRAAHRSAVRVEGQVIIVLEPSGAAACQDGASLTWRIVP